MLFCCVAGKKLLGNGGELGLATDPMDLPDLVEDVWIPLRRSIAYTERLGQVRDLAMVPADDHYLASILSAENFFRDRRGLRIQIVVVDRQVQRTRSGR